jgi:hypothetical protein
MTLDRHQHIGQGGIVLIDRCTTVVCLPMQLQDTAKALQFAKQVVGTCAVRRPLASGRIDKHFAQNGLFEAGISKKTNSKKKKKKRQADDINKMRQAIKQYGI